MTDCPRSKSSRSRFEPDRHAALHFTERDGEIVKVVFESRLLRRDHLIALGYLPSVGRANQTLRRLFDHGYLRRIFPELGPFGSQAIYAVGARSADLIAAAYGMERSEVLALSRKLPARLHIEHTLKITDFRLQMMEVCAQRGWQLRWVPEVFARHEYRLQDRGRWVERVLKPDAFASIQSPLGTRHFLIEIDLGHVSHSQWLRTLLHYRDHATMGLLKVAYDVPEAMVLTVTTGGELRLKHLMKGAPLPAERFLFTTFDRLARFGPDGRCYRTLASTDDVSLMERIDPVAVAP